MLDRARSAITFFLSAPQSSGETVSPITAIKGTILVADDDQSVREPLIELLRLNCYRVIAVDNGDQAYKQTCSQPVDLVLLDVRMPGPSGFSVCRAIKARPETRFLPVVLITGLACAEDRIRGIEAGADDFLHKPVKKEELLARVRSLVRLKRSTDELENAETVLCTLARSIEAKDPYTEGHCDRLSRSAVSLAGKIGMSLEDRNDLRRSGIVHDIGKVAVPEFILLKPGPLDASERKIMEEHTIIGERICAPLKSFRNVLPVIRWHHERQDGTGYPDHLKGKDIPLIARILQTVDIYDSLTTDRPYRAALLPEKALEIMWEETRRGWWDAELVTALQGLLAESPMALSMASA
jgi:putative two-component system response regulator